MDISRPMSDLQISLNPDDSPFEFGDVAGGTDLPIAYPELQADRSRLTGGVRDSIEFMLARRSTLNKRSVITPDGRIPLVAVLIGDVIIDTPAYEGKQSVSIAQVLMGLENVAGVMDRKQTKIAPRTTTATLDPNSYFIRINDATTDDSANNTFGVDGTMRFPFIYLDIGLASNDNIKGAPFSIRWESPISRAIDDNVTVRRTTSGSPLVATLSKGVDVLTRMKNGPLNFTMAKGTRFCRLLLSNWIEINDRALWAMGGINSGTPAEENFELYVNAAPKDAQFTLHLPGVGDSLLKRISESYFMY